MVAEGCEHPFCSKVVSLPKQGVQTNRLDSLKMSPRPGLSSTLPRVVLNFCICLEFVCVCGGGGVIWPWSSPRLLWDLWFWLTTTINNNPTQTICFVHSCWLDEGMVSSMAGNQKKSRMHFGRNFDSKGTVTWTGGEAPLRVATGIGKNTMTRGKQTPGLEHNQKYLNMCLATVLTMTPTPPSGAKHQCLNIRTSYIMDLCWWFQALLRHSTGDKSNVHTSKHAQPTSDYGSKNTWTNVFRHEPGRYAIFLHFEKGNRRGIARSRCLDYSRGSKLQK
jgi:hypothetical protein